MKPYNSKPLRWITLSFVVFIAFAIIVGICFIVRDIALSNNKEEETIQLEEVNISHEEYALPSLLLSRGTPLEFIEFPEETTEKVVYIYETVYEPIYETIILYPDDYEALREKADLLDAIYEDRVDHERYLYEKFPEAFTVWSYLTGEMGLNNYVAAGIMGNIMNECGGNSLKLQPLITSSHSMTYKGVSYHFYGICQWYVGYNPQMAGASLEKQLEYINSNIESIFDTYGYLYKKGFKYADFCALTDCKEAATAFMVVYERPGPSTKTIRQNNACYAYSVFVK